MHFAKKSKENARNIQWCVMDESRVSSSSTRESKTYTRRTGGKVSYRSSALEATAPSLTAVADDAKVQNAPPVREAQRIADRVRQKFKQRNNRGKRASKGGKSSAGGEGDDTDKAGRYDRRLKMNRDSAAASRIRREAYVKALEQKLYEEWATKNKLHEDLETERKEHSTLRRQYGVHAGVKHTGDDSSIMSCTPGGAVVAPLSAPDVAPGVVAPDREVSVAQTAPNITGDTNGNAKAKTNGNEDEAIDAVVAALTTSNAVAPSSPFSVFDAQVIPNSLLDNVSAANNGAGAVGSGMLGDMGGGSVRAALSNAFEKYPENALLGENGTEFEMDPLFNDSDLQSMLPLWMLNVNQVVDAGGNESTADVTPTFT